MNYKPFLRAALALLFLPFSAVYAQNLADIHPARETVLLKEDFSGPPVIVLPDRNYGDTAFASVKNGHYVLDAKNSARFWSLRLETPALSTHPDVLEMKMKVSTGKPSTVYGILWHTTRISQRTFNEYVFTVSSDGKFTIYVKINDKSLPLIDWTPCSCVATGNDVYNTLRIEEWDKGKYRFFINNQAVYEGGLIVPTFTTFGFYSEEHAVLSVNYIKFAVRGE